MRRSLLSGATTGPGWTKSIPKLCSAPDKEGGTIGTLPRCGSRTPMQWSKERNAGFSTAPAEKLYLSIDPSTSRPDVETEEKDPASMLNFTRALLKLRRDHPALANAVDFQPLYAEQNQYPFVYLRTADSEQILVSINPAAQSCSVTLQRLDNATPLLVQGAELRSGRLQMAPVSFGIFAVHAQGVHGEHVFPESLGGTDDLDNLALACPTCNGHKSNHILGIDDQGFEDGQLFHPRMDTWEDHFEFDPETLQISIWRMPTQSGQRKHCPKHGEAI